jgi:MFS family permease
MVTVFPLSWVFLFTRESPVRFLIIEIVAAVFGVAAIVASGIIADRVGRKSLLMGSAIAIAIYSGFAPQLLDAGAFGETIYMVIGFILLGLSFGQSSGAIASNFRQAYRYTASALTSDMAWLFGAGFAPLVALLLATNLGVIASGAYLLSGAFWTLLALWLSGQREAGDMDAGA